MTNLTPSPTDPPYDTWLTKVDAAKVIGVTTKTVENLMKQKRVRHMVDYLRDGRRISIFHPEDIAQYAEERRKLAMPLPTVLPSENGNGHRSHHSLVPATTSRQLLQRVEEMLAKAIVVPPPSQVASQVASQRPEVSDQLLLAKVFLTIHEAARLTGLSEANIRRRCQSGSLKAIKDGGWKIRRARLQKL